MVIEQFLVKIEHRKRIYFIENNSRRSLEHARVLQRLIVSFGNAQNHGFHVFAQIKIGRTNQIAHIFNNNEIDRIKIEHINRTTNHVAFKVTCATRINLHSRNALCLNFFRINRRRDIALNNRDIEGVSQSFNGCQNGRGFS